MASGFGRRFGSNKLLAEVDGVPLYHRAMAALAPAEFDRAVVCSPYPQILAAGERFGFLPLYNGGAAEGISASIRLGLARMSDLDGVLFAVCDQPWLTTKSIIRLKKSFLESPDAIYALSWQGRRGNPVVFPADLFGELAALTGDTGGGAVIRRHPERLRLVEAFPQTSFWMWITRRHSPKNKRISHRQMSRWDIRFDIFPLLRHRNVLPQKEQMVDLRHLHRALQLPGVVGVPYLRAGALSHVGVAARAAGGGHLGSIL